jgi:hypothetical protein
LETFCNTFLTQNVALVKVEMATKSLTRSLKDKRFNFVSQLSSLGKGIFMLSTYIETFSMLFSTLKLFSMLFNQLNSKCVLFF